jgi:dTDP-4-amino-4,6-dideoxygalactose transaminase
MRDKRAGHEKGAWANVPRKAIAAILSFSARTFTALATRSNGSSIGSNNVVMWRCATTRTRAIFPIHYAGVACEMDEIMAIAKRHNLLVVEDAAQGVFAQYKGRWLGAIGHMGCYSFHETKNFSCGEGGALVINDAVFEARAEILREKRTNRSQFLRGQVDKYTWVDIGSSYVLSDMLAAFLLGQLENAEKISIRRGEIFHRYAARLAPLVEKGLIRGPIVPQHCATNHHIFYVLTADMDERAALIARLRQAGILAVFHYVPLHSSPFAKSLCLPEISLPVTDDTARRLLRLPIYYDLNDREVDQVVGAIFDFYVGRGRARVEPSAGGRVVWGERGQRQLELARRADFQYHPATS